LKEEEERKKKRFFLCVTASTVDIGCYSDAVVAAAVAVAKRVGIRFIVIILMIAATSRPCSSNKK
jgi:hypothetical protein